MNGDQAQVDVAPEYNHTATFATVTIGGSSVVRISDRVTITTLNISGNAVVDLTSATGLTDITTINLFGNAHLTLRGDNGIGTVNIHDTATLDDRGEGTITKINKSPSCHYTTENSAVASGARVITNIDMNAGSGTFNDSAKKCTLSDAINFGASNPFTDFPGVNLGTDINLQKS